MAIAPHPNGECLVRVGLGGTAGSLSDLGYTRDGVRWSIRAETDGVLADNGGPVIPIDYQRFGVTARLSLPLMVYDQAVLNAMLLNQFGGVLGVEPQAGTMVALNGLTNRIVLLSPLDGLVWRFRHCIWMNSDKVLSTRAEPFTMDITCFPFAGVDPLSGKILYDNVNA